MNKHPVSSALLHNSILTKFIYTINQENDSEDLEPDLDFGRRATASQRRKIARLPKYKSHHLLHFGRQDIPHHCDGATRPPKSKSGLKITV